MHQNTTRAIAREYAAGVKAWRICQDRGISLEMLASVLYETGSVRNKKMARMYVMRDQDRHERQRKRS